MIELLAGRRVVEFAPFLPGPLSGSFLRALGADVVKIEPPGGDPYRTFEPRLSDGSSAAFHLANGGKESVVLDLKQEGDRRRALELCRGVDAFFDGYRPGVAERLGVGFDAVRAVAPTVVYCSITGYGQSGPRSSHPGHDLNYASLAGVVATTGTEDGPPLRPGMPLGDVLAGLTAALTVAAAFAEQPRRAHRLDVAITDCLLSGMTARCDGLLAGADGPRRGRLASPVNDVYRCADGRYLSIGAIEEHFWLRLCGVLGLDDLAADQDLLSDGSRRRRRDEIRGRLEAVFASRIRDEWSGLLEAADVPCTPVLDLEEALADSHVQARQLLQPLDGPAPWTLRFPALVDGQASSPAPAPALPAERERSPSRT